MYAKMISSLLVGIVPIPVLVMICMGEGGHCGGKGYVIGLMAIAFCARLKWQITWTFGRLGQLPDGGSWILSSAAVVLVILGCGSLIEPPLASIERAGLLAFPLTAVAGSCLFVIGYCQLAGRDPAVPRKPGEAETWHEYVGVSGTAETWRHSSRELLARALKIYSVMVVGGLVGRLINLIRPG